MKTLKTLKALEREHEQTRVAEEKSQQEQMFEAHLQRLAEQAEQLKAIYPDFDLERELQDERFQRLTSPNCMVSVEDAFYAVHHAEIEAAQMQYATQRTANKIANAVRSGSLRQTEAAVNHASPSLDIRDDPRKWSKEDREEVRRRVQRGEKIFL